MMATSVPGHSYSEFPLTLAEAAEVIRGNKAFLNVASFGPRSFGKNLVGLARQHGHTELARLLLDNGATEQAAVGRVRHACGHCGQPGALKACSRCHKARYCDKNCQASAWRGGHREECVAR